MDRGAGQSEGEEWAGAGRRPGISGLCGSDSCVALLLCATPWRRPWRT